jgi:hypothetical protein
LVVRCGRDIGIGMKPFDGTADELLGRRDDASLQAEPE